MPEFMAGENLSGVPETLRQERSVLQSRFSPRQSSRSLLRQHCALLDKSLRKIWRQTAAEHEQSVTRLSLIAVGGYGRGALFPGSDLDLLILTPPALSEAEEQFIHFFLTALWNLQMEVGSSVRSVQECLEKAREDLSIASTFLEARYLYGSRELLAQLKETLRANPPWKPEVFFAAKLAEQENRHARCSDTAFHLEPNLKEGPGGLRDIHQLQWLTGSIFGDSSLLCLRQKNLVTPEEYRQLLRAQSFLTRLRITLHYASGRHEDRLRLEQQRQLAEVLGYHERPGRSPVEQLMQKLYRAFADIMRIAAIAQENIALYLADQGSLGEDSAQPVRNTVPLPQADDPQLLQKILRLFRELAENPQSISLDALTQRALYKLRSKIQPRNLEQDPIARNEFLALLAQADGAYDSLKIMHQCGILGRLIPAFERITGRIQHDLFHVYTVDQHTLFLLRNIGLLQKQQETRMSVLKHAWAQVDKPELLVLAGLFHDIGKGRGGDHSQIGAQEARRFARRLQLSARDTELIIWLVEQHLQMSTVSQRRDLEDPQVIRDFARMVGDERHLAYLLLLTVADMRATNPDLWNDWKGLLLSTLYRATATELQQEDRSRQDLPHIVRDRQENALQCLTQEEQIRARVFWQHLSGAYFSRYSENELLWHIQQILAHKSRKTLVAVRTHQPEGSEILIYGPDRPGLFQQITGALDRQALNIIDARIDTSEDGRAIDTFLVIDNSHAFARTEQADQDLAARLRAIIEGETESKPHFGLRHRDPRHRFFAQRPAEIRVDNHALSRYTLLEVRAADHLGLLYRVGEVLRTLQLNIHGAKVSTFGERVEDTFFILNERGRQLTETQSKKLTGTLDEMLNGQSQ
ncbi:bifunctional uridylyltransferase/uridylyl-removing protein [Acidithiobacillus thiooxidans]|uniref:Bifunctional uridylyltransferase/uridylyl-removing enzyme n=1 Tax=Acidithiobacillus thiooxidans TaxID=930 RepID=A0A1C2I3F5_ACITH|nr:[protein-PII] uridylyltransferase [Acidithiobacillus thiooxidans]OCX68525.1 bifunctional uridylyltransferase/uridylyl-removing protein [Acidithiobacillus thiooxidans]OCX70514.1 bifunctional uridylyltransferase/uridylyl-removing protein [Acidithiobacillus thiooxidans]OCX78753.1 bifunctional uridylyltransferase/uridylyl-removing protein [Acidithiobacillus thiooxidans]OCX80632.1 bifunctional uridylyltransferase/uridylyl-removing protein [Acidithiobacillus thiooxidans]OCX80976.1 bifunctional ur